MKTDKTKQPSADGDNGKDAQGRFTSGNKFGRGNPFAKKVAKLRSALLSAIEPADVIAVVKILIAKAKRGSIPAIKEVLDRSIGKPLESDLLEKLENLECTINEFERKSKFP